MPTGPEDDPRQAYRDAAMLNATLAIWMTLVSGVLAWRAIASRMYLYGNQVFLAAAVVALAFGIAAAHTWAWRSLRRVDRVPTAALVTGTVLSALQVVAAALATLVLAIANTPLVALGTTVICVAIASVIGHWNALLVRRDVDVTGVVRGFPMSSAVPQPTPPEAPGAFGPRAPPPDAQP